MGGRLASLAGWRAGGGSFDQREHGATDRRDRGSKTFNNLDFIFVEFGVEEGVFV